MASVLAWLDRSDIPTDEQVRAELRRFVPEYSSPQYTRPGLAPVIELRAG
jgi:hypothetical protein